MKNKDYYRERGGAYSGFNRFCRVNAKPGSNDCVGCPCYGLALGMNSCFNAWLEMEAQAEADDGGGMASRAPWTYEDAKAALGKVIEYNHANHAKAAYLVIGAYQAQNGRVTVLMAGDAVSVEKLAGNAHYTIGGKPCAREVAGVADPCNRRDDNGRPFPTGAREDWA